MKKHRAFVLFLIGPIVLLGIICGIVFCAFSMDYPKPNQRIITTNETGIKTSTKDEDNLEQDYLLLKKSLQKSRVWYMMSVFWTAVQYLSVIYPFTLSAAILYIEHFSNTPKAQTIPDSDVQNKKEAVDPSAVQSKTEIKNQFIMIFSVLSMTMVIAVQAINPMAHARGYRQAYMCIDNAINKYQAQSIKDDQLLIDALNESELAINKAFENN